MNLFLANAWGDNPFYFWAWVLIVAFSICVHEYAHAAVALRLGDDTAATEGHLTLNPFKQMGLNSLIALLAIGIAWGAVPVDPRLLRTRGRAAAVSFAGPAANFLLAAISALLWTIFVRFDLLDGAAGLPGRFLMLATTANSTLFLFNLLPVPMLDGWSVFGMFFPRLLDISSANAQTISWVALIALLATPLGEFIWRYGELLAALLMRFAAVFFGHG
ncbi:MAG: site-2 protease family protein [Kiritimatiellaeota bacterium]|nr:site-2 protease family protein [Kiritimatiellota bacterium]